MQTFVPCDTFTGCASVLDRQRLGKQRVEVLQILKALKGGGGWKNHPAVKMWRGYENALVDYGLFMCIEWKQRGYKDTCADKIEAYYDPSKDALKPLWWYGPIHASHRAALLHKNPDHYRQFGWTEEPALNYHWPEVK